MIGRLLMFIDTLSFNLGVIYHILSNARFLVYLFSSLQNIRFLVIG